MMRTCLIVGVTVCFLAGCMKEPPQQAAPETRKGPSQSGEALFKQFCSTCHPEGGNVSDPKRNLHGDSLRRDSISTPEDIMRIMRKPKSRMIPFDEKTIPDGDARAIGEYVLNAFR